MSPKIDKINIYSETRRNRVYVGQLKKMANGFVFEYSPSYQRLKTAVSLGPDLPIWKNKIESPKLFATLLDRIPSKHNPAYPDYCREWNLDPHETDPMILLTTIGHRGPSTFVFEPAIRPSYDFEQVKTFRHRLGLNQRDFAALFDLPQATVVRLESGHSESKAILHYLKLCDTVPAALAHLLKERGQVLHGEKREKLLKLSQTPA